MKSNDVLRLEAQHCVLGNFDSIFFETPNHHDGFLGYFFEERLVAFRLDHDLAIRADEQRIVSQMI